MNYIFHLAHFYKIRQIKLQIVKLLPVNVLITNLFPIFQYLGAKHSAKGFQRACDLPWGRCNTSPSG